MKSFFFSAVLRVSESPEIFMANFRQDLSRMFISSPTLKFIVGVVGVVCVSCVCDETKKNVRNHGTSDRGSCNPYPATHTFHSHSQPAKNEQGLEFGADFSGRVSFGSATGVEVEIGPGFKNFSVL